MESFESVKSQSGVSPRVNRISKKRHKIGQGEQQPNSINSSYISALISHAISMCILSTLGGSRKSCFTPQITFVQFFACSFLGDSCFPQLYHDQVNDF